MSISNLSDIYGSGSGGIDTGGGGGGGGIDIIEVHNRWRVEYASINATALINKYVLINAEPKTATKVKVEVITGPTCDYSVDFVVDPVLKQVQWNGLGLDGSLTSGDKLRITYFEV